MEKKIKMANWKNKDFFAKFQKLINMFGKIL